MDYDIGIVRRRRIISPAMAGPGAAAAGGITLEDPSDFGADLFAWYKADTGVTLQTGSPIIWGDQSGNARDLDVASYPNPQVGATSFNGFTGITMNGGGFWNNDNGQISIPGNAAMLFFAVQLHTVAGSNPFGRLFSMSPGTPNATDYQDAGNLYFLLNNGVAEWSIGHVGASSNPTVATFSDGDYMRIIVVFDGSAIKLYKNGVKTATDGVDSGSFAASSNFGISGMVSGTATFNYGIGLNSTYAEFGIVTGDKTAYVTALDNYLKARYGLS